MCKRRHHRLISGFVDVEYNSITQQWEHPAFRVREMSHFLHVEAKMVWYLLLHKIPRTPTYLHKISATTIHTIHNDWLQYRVWLSHESSKTRVHLLQIHQHCIGVDLWQRKTIWETLKQTPWSGKLDKMSTKLLYLTYPFYQTSCSQLNHKWWNPKHKDPLEQKWRLYSKWSWSSQPAWANCKSKWPQQMRADRPVIDEWSYHTCTRTITNVM